MDERSRFVNEAGAAMEGIVGQVRELASRIGEIGGATHEQAQGLGQVGEAVAQLDQMTQQNAALVEESAAAAQSLDHQARGLVQAVSRFQLGHDAAAPHVPAVAVAPAAPRLAGMPGALRRA